MLGRVVCQGRMKLGGQRRMSVGPPARTWRLVRCSDAMDVVRCCLSYCLLLLLLLLLLRMLSCAQGGHAREAAVAVAGGDVAGAERDGAVAVARRSDQR